MLRKVSARGALVSLLLASATVPAVALEPSGSAIRVDPAVNASGTGGRRVLELQGAVFMGDEIVASPYGLAQIRFIDNTRIVIGPNSRLRIDTFVFNPNNTAKKVTVSALRGTFRFISGNSPHSAYTIRTPTVTLGVRGTVVDFSAGPTSSSFVFQDGEGTACDLQNRCTQIEEQCDIWIAPRSGQISQTSGAQSQLQLATNFPFMQSEWRLAPEFRFHNPTCAVVDQRFFGPPPDNSDHIRPPQPPPYVPPPPPPPPPPVRQPVVPDMPQDMDMPPPDGCGGCEYG